MIKRILYIGVFFVALGCGSARGQGTAIDLSIQGWRNSYFAGYRAHWDDWTQYMPGVALLGLNLAGVKGRSNWWGTLAVSGMTTIFVTTTVNLVLKQTADRWRPDNSNTLSFPSGHTATAFAMAALLYREYGRRNPWIGIGGYTLATATAFGRIINNKHWFTDTLAGAAIGILAVELSYRLTDLIFKGRNQRK